LHIAASLVLGRHLRSCALGVPTNVLRTVLRNVLSRGQRQLLRTKKCSASLADAFPRLCGGGRGHRVAGSPPRKPPRPGASLGLRGATVPFTPHAGERSDVIAGARQIQPSPRSSSLASFANDDMLARSSAPSTSRGVAGGRDLSAAIGLRTAISSCGHCRSISTR
jgi:hypothetical protein